MKILKIFYKKTGKTAPYYYDYSLAVIIGKPIRKFFLSIRMMCKKLQSIDIMERIL